MDNPSNILPDFTAQRSPEEKLIIAKVLTHVSDYIRAVRRFGENFMRLTLDMKHPYGGGAVEKAVKAGSSKATDDITILFNGKLAYIYLFNEDTENELGFMPVCEALGFNARVFRRKLLTMTKAQADMIQAYVFDDKKTDHKRRERETL